MQRHIMQQQDCWNQTGVLGDRTCPELSSVVHCHNCSVYRQAGRGLLERPIPDEYVTEWTSLLTQVRNQQDAVAPDTVSVNIFQLGREWLALPTTVIKQILPPKPVHSIPHRSNQLLRGIVNVQGQLLLCISLEHLLGIEVDRPPVLSSPDSAPQGTATVAPATSVNVTSYLLVIEEKADVWAFEVDKMYGLHRCAETDLRNAPALGSPTLKCFTQSIMPWKNETVSYLDVRQVFEALRQEAL